MALVVRRWVRLCTLGRSSLAMHSMFLDVLIVDDDPAILRLVETILRKAGYRTRTACDGREAIAELNRSAPHFLVTDWEMPHVNGIELCEYVRQQQWPHYLYVMLLTIRKQKGDLLRGLNAGANDYLTKPVSEEELIARLRSGQRILELEHQLVRFANTDPLTGISNRWSFCERCEQELSRAARHDLPLACVLIDIDYFKNINDSLGHLVGDVILKSFARFLSDSCRASDYVCRYGGEEFCVLLPETTEPAAVEWAERVRLAVSEIEIPVRQSRVKITASFGVTGRGPNTRAAEDLVEQADIALLLSKQHGRNRTTAYSAFQAANQTTRPTAAPNAAESFHGALARHVMTSPVYCLSRSSTLRDAAELFLRVRINSAPVIDEQGQLVGIVSEKDLMVVKQGTDAWEKHVSDVMKTNVVRYEDETPADAIYEFLCRATIRRVVIVRDGRPVGVVSRGSILRWVGNWGVAGVTHPYSPARELDDARRQTLREQLIRVLDALERHVGRLRQRADVDALDLGPAVVEEASRVQELASDLLGCAQSTYVFVPEALLSSDDRE
jgi:two-component system, cell cycle response regulator